MKAKKKKKQPHRSSKMSSMCRLWVLMLWSLNTQTWCTHAHTHMHTAAAAQNGRLLDICELIQSQSCGAFCIAKYILLHVVCTELGYFLVLTVYSLLLHPSQNTVQRLKLTFICHLSAVRCLWSLSFVYIRVTLLCGVSSAAQRIVGQSVSYPSRHHVGSGVTGY